MSDQELVETLRRANGACIARTTPLLTMLGACRQQFSLYVDSHKAKDTEEGNQKAEVNQGFVDQIDETLANFQARVGQEQETSEQVGAD